MSTPRPGALTQTDPPVPTVQRSSADDRIARSGAQTVHRALRILQVFSQLRPAHSLADIAGALELTVPTTHRLLRAMQDAEFVVQDPHTRAYSLGPAILRMAAVIEGRDDILAISTPVLARLRETSGESVGFHWLVGDRRVCVLELVSEHSLRMASGVGHTYPLTGGASSKAILSAMPEARVDELLAATAAGTVSKQFRDDVATARRLGYAASVSETVDGAAAVAAPIMRSSGEVIGALNLTGPVIRMPTQKLAEFGESLVAAGAEIMEQFGRRAPR